MRFVQKKLRTVENHATAIMGCPSKWVELDVPEGEEGLLGESGAGGGHGEHEGGDAKGGVDRHEAGAERGSGALAAEQQQEAEESHHELK